MTPSSSSQSEPPELLTIWFIPSLVAVLLRAENDKGSPLTEFEVNSIRDKSSAVMTPSIQIPTLVKERGYEDIDADHAWTEWQRVRLDFTNADSPNQSTDPTLSSGTPPAGQESRHP